MTLHEILLTEIADTLRQMRIAKRDEQDYKELQEHLEYLLKKMDPKGTKSEKGKLNLDQLTPNQAINKIIQYYGKEKI